MENVSHLWVTTKNLYSDIISNFKQRSIQQESKRQVVYEIENNNDVNSKTKVNLSGDIGKELSELKDKIKGYKTGNKVAAKAGKTASKTKKTSRKTNDFIVKTEQEPNCSSASRNANPTSSSNKTEKKSRVITHQKEEIIKTTRESNTDIKIIAPIKQNIEKPASRRAKWTKEWNNIKAKEKLERKKPIKIRELPTILTEYQNIIQFIEQPNNAKKSSIKSTTNTNNSSVPAKHQTQTETDNRFYNFFQPLSETTTMPLISESVVKPPKGIMKKFNGTATESPPTVTDDTEQLEDKEDNEGPWIPVGKLKPAPKYNVEPTAPNYAPKTLLPDNGNRRLIDAETNLTIPTLLIIKPKRKVNYDLGRILHGLLIALQNNNPEISFGPIDLGDSETPRINNVDQISGDTKILQKYVDNPRQTNWGTFVARIVVHSNTDLHKIRLSDIQLRNWLQEEKISIEYNDLKATAAANVGIIYNVCPREDSVKLQQDRLKQYLVGRDYGDFHVRRQTIQLGEKKPIVKSTVFMIVAGKQDVITVNKALEYLDDNEFISYMSWEEYRNLAYLQKKKFIEDQRDFMKDNASLLIDGFIDHGNNVPMVYKEENDDLEGMIVDSNTEPTHPLETVSVTTYLLNMIKTGKGNPIFEHVYPPIRGVREVLVRKQQIVEAASFIKSCHGELARKMNDKSIRMVFKNPESAIKAAEQDPWRPFKFTSLIPESKVPERQIVIPKRVRHPTTQKSTYSQIAAKFNGNLGKTPTASTSISTISVTADEHSILENKHKKLQADYDEIKECVTTMRSQLQDLSEKKLHDIEAVLDEKVLESLERCSNKRSKPDMTVNEIDIEWKGFIEDTLTELKENKVVNDRMDDIEKRLETTSAMQDQKLEQLTLDFKKEMASVNNVIVHNHAKQTKVCNNILDRIDEKEKRLEEQLKGSFEDIKATMFSMFRQNNQQSQPNQPVSELERNFDSPPSDPETPRSKLGNEFMMLELEQQNREHYGESGLLDDDEVLADL